MYEIILHHSSTLFIEGGFLNQIQSSHYDGIYKPICGGHPLSLPSDATVTSGYLSPCHLQRFLGIQTPVRMLAQQAF